MRILSVFIIVGLICSVCPVGVMAGVGGNPKTTGWIFSGDDPVPKDEESPEEGLVAPKTSKKTSAFGRFFSNVRDLVRPDKPIESVAPSPEMKEPGEGLKIRKKAE